MRSLGRAVFVAGALAVAPMLAQAGARPAPRLIPGGDSRAPISISAHKLEYFNKESKLVYSGDVVARQGAATLKASRLVIVLAASVSRSKSRAGLLPSGGSQDVSRMEAAGPVTIVENSEVGTGDSAVYDKAANKVYLIGHVSLSQGSNITTGDKLTYDLATNQAQVEGGRVESIFTPGSGNDALEGKPGRGVAPARPAGKAKDRDRRGAVAQSKEAR